MLLKYVAMYPQKATAMAASTPKACQFTSAVILSASHDPAHAGERAEMIVGIAEHRIDHRDALEVVADLVLHGHADTAMQLDRLLADEFSRAADLHLGGADRLAPLHRV